MFEKRKLFLKLILKKTFLTEICIIFLLLFVINNFTKYAEKTISSDGICYYEYLPSIFIYKDFVRKDVLKSEKTNLYKRINKQGLYVDYGEYKVNKYSCGTAVLQFPFFSYALMSTKLEGNYNDGYQLPFQKSVFYAAIFYLFLQLIFFGKILQLYDVKKIIIVICQIFLVFSTSIIHYVNDDASFSHVYSLFAITAFIYSVKSYFKKQHIKFLILAFVFLGIIILLRQINFIIILIIPFLADSFQNLKSGFLSIIKNKKFLIIGVFIFVGISSLQFFAWYLQTGSWLIYSYQGEGFNWSSPQLINILFSYKKGLFVYSPVIFIAFLSSFWLLINKKYYLFFTWFLFFLILTYILSSWWSWYYGCSFGLRAYIDFYVILFIPMALMLNEIKAIIKIVIILVSLLTIPLNIIQIYQYKNFILHWIEMDKEKYWKIFLKTDEKYKDLVWKNEININNFKLEKELFLGDIFTKKHSINNNYRIECASIPNFERVNTIQVLFESDFNENDETKINFSIFEKEYFFYYNIKPVIQFHETRFNELQTGLYNFVFKPVKDSKNVLVAIQIECSHQNSFLKNVRIKFLSQK